MAIIRELNKVENASLHDAILLTTLVDNNILYFLITTLVVLFSMKYQ